MHEQECSQAPTVCEAAAHGYTGTGMRAEANVEHNRSRRHSFPATCQFCHEVITHVALAMHEHECSQAPTVCEAAAHGCTWAGLRWEANEHHAICLRVICLQMARHTQAEYEVEWDELQRQLAEMAL
eukprot:CAMPEP_0119327702 /NCGR_PEP_ID=MMETSP1333-20130426/71480_1 /TAXON_ID=418940 /ORGANISM="Scyphosphaera apsteinii, Strain RCC1455" /LENGTH=126 /DNA_ID=CAMNT_0007336371 /DNA_START=287 /DNA_END=667 /DNA_ORIENTATION=+